MYACSEGHIDIARMLVSEYNANVDFQNTVRAMMRFVTPLHLVVIDVLYSLSDSSISSFGVYVSNSCVCDLVHKCVYLDRVC